MNQIEKQQYSVGEGDMTDEQCAKLKERIRELRIAYEEKHIVDANKMVEG